jgi:hypothetical protein
VEGKVQHLRCRTPLTYADLEYFESPEHRWFQRFCKSPAWALLRVPLRGIRPVLS